MKIAVVLILFAVVVRGYPGSPSGYDYKSNQPRGQIISSYDAPLASVGPLPSASSIGSDVNTQSYSLSNDNGSNHNGNIIQKNIYVHLPSPKVEENRQRLPLPYPPPPQIHYKIIFVKAPAVSPAAVPVIPPLPQNEERIIVYVLVRQPDEDQDIVIPTPKPTEPSRPEVYFIRYKSKTDDSEKSTAFGASSDSLTSDGPTDSIRNISGVVNNYVSGPY